jgi:hypothetical protein
MTAKPKSSRRLVSDKRMPKASLLERLDRPTGPDLRPQLSGMETRLGAFEAQQDIHTKDIAWLKAGVERALEEIQGVEDEVRRFAKPSLWPLWTMLIVELAGLGALLAKVYGYAPY